VSDDRPIKTALLFPWCPEVDGGQIVETSAHPEVAMRLEYVALLDGWRLEGLDIGGQPYQAADPDLRALKLPPVAPAMRVTIRVRNALDERQRFPGARIIGTAIR
jgi:hypothetical protein